MVPLHDIFASVHPPRTVRRPATARRPRSSGAARKSVKTASASAAEAEPEAVPVRSEGELTSELAAIVKSLDAAADWEQRVTALRRLHGLAIGAGGAYPAFGEHLRSALKDPLVAQLVDRRSQVSRVACAAISASVEAAGQRSEPVVAALLPELFKLAVISIVVMADAADACVRAMLTHCHSPRLLRQVTDALAHEKSNRLRQRCTEWIHLMLREWPASAYEAQLDVVRIAVKRSVSDAGAGALRAVGRVDRAQPCIPAAYCVHVTCCIPSPSAGCAQCRVRLFGVQRRARRDASSSALLQRSILARCPPS